MRKPSTAIWLFPIGLFIFTSIFVTVKFIFIFFFSTAFEPLVLFNLTPLTLVPGFTNIQLLFITLAVLLVDTYLHLKASKRYLLISFVLTAFLISGLVLTILVAPADTSYLLHYVLLCCLLLVIVIDQKRLFLLPSEQPIQPPERKRRHQRYTDTPAPAPTQPTLAPQPTIQYAAPAPMPAFDSSMLDAYKATSELMVQNMRAMNEFLERRMEIIENLEQRVEERKDTLLLQQERFIDRLIDANTKKLTQPLAPPAPSSTIHASFNEKIEDHLVIGDSPEWLAVVQRGIVKQISNSFVEALGYARGEMLNKSFIGFFTATGKEEAKKYWLINLTGSNADTYKTMLLTKNHQAVPVEITRKPTIYNGMFAELLIIKQNAAASLQ